MQPQVYLEYVYLCREKSGHYLLDLDALPRLPVLDRVARQFVHLDPEYSPEFLARKGFSDRGLLAALLPGAGSFTQTLPGCSGASLVGQEGRGHFIQVWSETWICT